MADTRFTALGLSHSGKTCYVMGMYDMMSLGQKGFTLFTNGAKANQLEGMLDNFYDSDLKKDRFPGGTNTQLSDELNYSFLLKYKGKSILSFDWTDYAGKLLDSKDDNDPNFQKLMTFIHESTCLYIFIDGELLSCDNKRMRMRKINMAARKINHFLDSYANNCNDVFPPIVFIVTKSDLISPDVSSDEIENILEESFSNVWGTDGAWFYSVIFVNLGENISDDDYTGEAKPENMHLPLYLGLYIEFLKAVKIHEQRIKSDNNIINNEIGDIKNQINKNNTIVSKHNQENAISRNIIRNLKSQLKVFRILKKYDDLIYDEMKKINNRNQDIQQILQQNEKLNEEIKKKQKKIKTNESSLNEFKKYLTILREEIISNQDKIACYELGKETEFKDISFFKI